MKKISLLFLAILLFVYSFGQVKDSTYYRTDKLSLGAGLGLNYGGLGGNLNFFPHEAIGLFIAVGAADKWLGLNAGIRFRIINSNKIPIRPFFTYMWGYNAIAVDENGYHTTSFGTTFGMGIETRMKPKGYGYFSFAVLLPKRRNSFERLTGGTASDILISAGYHLLLFSRKRPLN